MLSKDDLEEWRNICTTDLIYFIFCFLYFSLCARLSFFFNSIVAIILYIDVFYQFLLCNFINFGC